MLALLLTADADAYTLRTTEDGAEIRYEAFPVRYAQLPRKFDPYGAAEAVPAAFEAWERADTPIAFQQEPAGAPDRADRNAVWFESDWPFDADVLAVTSSWSTDDGEIIGFDIQVNATVPWSTDGAPGTFDLQAAMTHEVGHALGLDHSEVESASMFAKQLPGDVFRRELAEDDLAAIEALYGGGSGSELSCSSAPASPPALLAGLLVLPLLRRRR